MSGKDNQLVIGDADALIALAHQKDANHTKALSCLVTLEKQSASVIYPATAFAEAVTAAERKMKDVGLAKTLIDIFAAGDLAIVEVNEESLRQAATYFNTSASHQDTFFDAIICATARTYHTKTIFSFDKGYQKHGFVLLENV